MNGRLRLVNRVDIYWLKGFRSVRMRTHLVNELGQCQPYCGGDRGQRSCGWPRAGEARAAHPTLSIERGIDDSRLRGPDLRQTYRRG